MSEAPTEVSEQPVAESPTETETPVDTPESAPVPTEAPTDSNTFPGFFRAQFANYGDHFVGKADGSDVEVKAADLNTAKAELLAAVQEKVEEALNAHTGVSFDPEPNSVSGDTIKVSVYYG